MSLTGRYSFAWCERTDPLFVLPIPVHNYPHVLPDVLLLRALGNARRFTTVEILENRIMTEAELAHYHGIALPSMSRHLHILLKAGVLASVRKAGHVYFSIAPEFLPIWKGFKEVLKKNRGVESKRIKTSQLR